VETRPPPPAGKFWRAAPLTGGGIGDVQFFRLRMERVTRPEAIELVRGNAEGGVFHTQRLENAPAERVFQRLARSPRDEHT